MTVGYLRWGDNGEIFTVGWLQWDVDGGVMTVRRLRWGDGGEIFTVGWWRWNDYAKRFKWKICMEMQKKCFPSTWILMRLMWPSTSLMVNFNGVKDMRHRKSRNFKKKSDTASTSASWPYFPLTLRVQRPTPVLYYYRLYYYTLSCHHIKLFTKTLIFTVKPQFLHNWWMAPKLVHNQTYFMTSFRKIFFGGCRALGDLLS